MSRIVKLIYLLIFVFASTTYARGGFGNKAQSCPEGQHQVIKRVGRTVTPTCALDYVRGVCEVSKDEEDDINQCLRETSEDICENIPDDQRRDCYEEPGEETDGAEYANKCLNGTVNGFADMVKGVAKFFTKTRDWALDHKKYEAKVRREAYSQCSQDLEVKRQQRLVDQAKKNLKYYDDVRPHIEKLNQIQSQCVYRQIRKGQPLSIDLSLPGLDEVRTLYACLNRKTQAELACSVIIPGLATGIGGGILLKSAKDFLFVRRLTKDVKAAIDHRVEKLKREGVLSPKELESIKHQEDLLEYLRSRGVADVVRRHSIDAKAIADGVIDSDLGKLKHYRAFLETKSPQSEYLLQGLQGRGNSKGQLAMKQFIDKHLAGKPLIDPPIKVDPDLELRLKSPDRSVSEAAQDELARLKNDHIRKVFSQIGPGPSLFHDWPGMFEAMRELETNSAMTFRQFEQRMLASLNHNSFGQGFGKNVLNPGFQKMLKDKGYPDFLAGSYYAGPVVDGVTTVNYGMPLSFGGIIHTVADRVSGATGGTVKFLYEMADGQIKNPKDPIPMGKLNLFGKNGLEAIRDLWFDGKGGSPFGSNPTSTIEQLAALEDFAKKASFLSAKERVDAVALVRAGKQRTAAFQSFSQPPNVDYQFGPDGKLDRIHLRSPENKGGKYIGTITKDTPQNEATELIEKFRKEEARINGDPMSNMLSPRLLTKTEVIQAGVPAMAAYRYCNVSKNLSRDASRQATTTSSSRAEAAK